MRENQLFSCIFFAFFMIIIEYPINVISTNNLLQDLENGPIGTLFLPKQRINGNFNDLSGDLERATQDIKIAYDHAKDEIGKFRDDLVFPVKKNLQTKLASKTQLMSRLEYVGKLLRTAYDRAHPDKAGKPIVLVQKVKADEFLYPPKGSQTGSCALSTLNDYSDEEIELLSPTGIMEETKILEEMDQKDRYEYSKKMADFYSEKAKSIEGELTTALSDWQNNQLLTDTKRIF